MFKTTSHSLALVAASLAFAPAAQAADSVVTKVIDLGALSVPSVLNYATSFGGTPNSYTNADIAARGVVLTSVDTFYENYVFVVPDAVVVSLTSTVSLPQLFEISNLQARLYEGTVDTVLTGTAGPALVTAWGESFTVGGSVVTNRLVAPTMLEAGSYVLQVRGNVTGAFGGSYVGTLIAGVVPEPATWAMFGAGMLALGIARRRSAKRG